MGKKSPRPGRRTGSATSRPGRRTGSRFARALKAGAADWFSDLEAMLFRDAAAYILRSAAHGSVDLTPTQLIVYKQFASVQIPYQIVGTGGCALYFSNNNMSTTLEQLAGELASREGADVERELGSRAYRSAPIDIEQMGERLREGGVMRLGGRAQSTAIRINNNQIRRHQHLSASPLCQKRPTIFLFVGTKSNDVKTKSFRQLPTFLPLQRLRHFAHDHLDELPTFLPLQRHSH